ncbi:MAG: phosphoheptose isomerase [Balneolaceae bacterium]|nr:phosphoheptose isomerase [Balneolaceae bacterium]
MKIRPSAFADTYFDNMPVDELKISGKLSPKILIVQPGKRLSWQYHHRRAEIWKVIEGPVGVMTSDTDEQAQIERFEAGDLVKLKQGERHRLVGLDDWGILAEIWQHTDPENPSDENDIVRLQDDFGR